MLKALKIASYPARRNIARALSRSSILPDHAKLSFSADGEDLIALSWLRGAGIEPRDIRYLDIGAAEAARISNTHLMATLGGSGVLVEPDPDQAKILHSARPRDVVLNVGVAFDERRSARLWRLTSRVFNTFLEKQAELIVEVSKRDWKPEQRQEIVDTIDVELVPADVILRDHFEGTPHFISIDTEGANFDILRSINFGRYRPIIICVEGGRPICDYEQLLGPHGYERICQTPDNLLFRLK
jgi:FkbM family methyltransferase